MATMHAGVVGKATGDEAFRARSASDPLRPPGTGLTELLRPLIPRALLDGPGWDRWLACVAELPEVGSTAFLGCEFRLGEDAPAADLFLVVRPGSPFERHFIRRGEAAHPGSAAAALARYLVEVGQADSTLRDCIEGTMLEYDLAETPAGRRPDPGVFLKVRLAERSEPHERPRPLPIAVLAGAVGWTDDGELRRWVDRVLEALPPNGRVAHVGALPERAPRAVRMVAQGIGRAEVGGVLERLGRRGSIRPATEVLTDLGEVLPRFRLSVDAAPEGLLPRIGLELYPAGSWSGERNSWLITGRSDWRPVVERLERRGWCLPAKAQGLLEWCALDKMFDRRGVFLVFKGINHVKLTVTDGGAAAKAYAGMMWSLAPDGSPARIPSG